MNPATNFKSELVFAESFPQDSFSPKTDLLIVDTKLAGQFKNWAHVYEVAGGEDLKDLKKFPGHVEKIISLWDIAISRKSRVVALGGGSVGDFAGFFASVFKRGVVFEQCPSTWVAAVDSAHGGKTALNVEGKKNQIGSFYPATRVFLIKDILLSQPEARATEGLGELVKTALLDKKLFANIQSGGYSEPSQILWKNLESAIAVKYKIVIEDPYETKGLRKILNLGHTMGHVIEAALGKPHGESVTQGIYFALNWSQERGLLPLGTLKAAHAMLQGVGLKESQASADFKPIEAQKTLALLLQDKKMTVDSKVDFVFLRDIGMPAVYPVSAEEILAEAFRQGWAR